MQSKAKDVATYLRELPEERRAPLTALRELCLETLTGYEEVMEYGMPGYKKDGVGEVGFASQKHYISLYILKQAVLDAHRADLSGLSVGKCCIRYGSPRKMDFAVIRKLLVGTRESNTRVC